MFERTKAFLIKAGQTVIIDRKLKLGTDEIHLIALTYDKDSYILWTMDRLAEDKEDIDHLGDPSNQTNREAMKRLPLSATRLIKHIEIGGEKLKFNGSRVYEFHNPGNRSFEKLQYLMDQGVDLSHLDNEALKEMRLIAYTNSRTEPKRKIKAGNEPMKVKFASELKYQPVEYKYSLDYNLDEPVELQYYNPIVRQDESFFVHKFEAYTYENYVESVKGNEKYNEVPKEQIEEMLKELKKYFVKMEDQGKCLILMTYEADSSLSFSSTDYLDRKIHVHRAGDDTGTMAFLFRPDERVGEFGKRLYIAPFSEISKDKIDPMDFEMWMISKDNPEAIIEV